MNEILELLKRHPDWRIGVRLDQSTRSVAIDYRSPTHAVQHLIAIEQIDYGKVPIARFVMEDMERTLERACEQEPPPHPRPRSGRLR